MRSASDIISVQAMTVRRLTLDLERMEKDPVWIQISETLGAVQGTVAFEEAVLGYIRHYIVRDQFPHHMPATNGPGDIDQIKLEVQCP